jgi:hypothetical protein
VVSGQKSASVSTAAQHGTVSGCEQSHARLFYSISHIRNTNAREAGGTIQLPIVASLELLFSGPSACHFGKQTRGICIQLSAPDILSNAAKRRDQMKTSNSKQPENRPTTHAPEQPETPTKPKVATEARFWPMPKGCVNMDEQAEAKPHIFVGGVRPQAPPKK